MQKSATALGCEYGVSGQEMNRILAKQGFLEGSPGSYSVTEKGLPYAVETDHHRGTGGYECYNRYWTTRTFDDSIKDVLNVTDELKHEVRREVAADRAKMYATLAAGCVGCGETYRKLEDCRQNLSHRWRCNHHWLWHL